MTSEGAMCVSFPSFFASAEMASRAMEDAVSNPAYQGNQDSTRSTNDTEFT